LPDRICQENKRRNQYCEDKPFDLFHLMMSEQIKNTGIMALKKSHYDNFEEPIFK
jgi:hypothetical protein